MIELKACAAGNQGDEFFEKGDFSRAVECYRKAIELYPGYAVFYNNLGNALVGLGEAFRQEAIENVRSALRIDPGYEEAHRNLARMIRNGAIRQGRECTVSCPVPECDGKITVTLPLFGRRASSRCPVCDGAQVTVNGKGIQEIGIFKAISVEGFPRSLPEGLRDALRKQPHGVWLLEEGNVVIKSDRPPEYLKEQDCVLDVELYHIAANFMPVCRVVFVILDHLRNPTVQSCFLNINNPRYAWRLRFLKTLTKVHVHIYDSQDRYCFTRDADIAQSTLVHIENTGGPVDPTIRLMDVPRTNWADYVDGLISTAKDACRSLPSECLNFERASARIADCAVSCLCENCGCQAITTTSQYREGNVLDVAKMKSRDAIFCRGCNMVLCMDCAIKRVKVDENGRVISPLTCSVCGEQFSKT